jgi:hypothetical protein
LRVADIAGVGLALQQRTPGRGGMWGLAVWTVDGRRVWSGGIQRKAQLAAPHTTTIAAAAVAVYQHVLDRQGPNGPLATQALQRHQPVTPYTHWTGYWDPSGANDARVAQDLGR